MRKNKNIMTISVPKGLAGLKVNNFFRKELTGDEKEILKKFDNIITSVPGRKNSA